MAFKMKYTNGKTSDTTAFPFKGGVDAGSSPAKGWFKDIGKKVADTAKAVTKDVDWSTVGKGAAQGAAAGSVAGPWGAVIGGLGGAVMGGMSGGGGEEKQEPDTPVDDVPKQNLPNQELTAEQQQMLQQQQAVA